MDRVAGFRRLQQLVAELKREKVGAERKKAAEFNETRTQTPEETDKARGPSNHCGGP
jgi:hypothetical protein